VAETLETIFVSVLGGVGTGIVGLVGLALQQRYSENTQQINTTLSELENMTDRCVAHAGQVWNAIGDPGSADVAETICLLHDIGVFSRFVTDRVKTSALRINPALVNFRQATTADNFDVKDRPPDPARSIDIRSAAAALKIAYREVNYDRRKLHIPFLS
jgi:hypothetical protein